MGLDTVELVMNVESEFDIAILDDDDGALCTAGDLCDFIARQKQAESQCLHPAAFVRIRRALIDVCGATRDAVRVPTGLQTLFPAESRRQKWREFEVALGLPVPGLVYPAPYRAAARTVCVLLFIALIVGPVVVHPLLFPAALLSPVLVLILAMVLEWGFQRCKVGFALPEPTVGVLTRYVALRNAGRLVPNGAVSGEHDQIWPRLRRVISQTLSIPEAEITRQSRFVEDLRVD